MKSYVQKELLVVIFAGICLLSLFFLPFGVFGADSSAVGDSSLTLEMVETQDSESVAVDKTLQAETGQTEVVVWLSEYENFERVATRSDAVSVENRFWLIDAAVVTVDLAQVDVEQIATIAGVEKIHANFEVEIGDVTRSATAPVSAIGPEQTAGAESVSATYGLEQIRAPTAWDEYNTKGESTRVAVLDTGIAIDHDDLELYSDNPTDPTYPGGWAEIGSSGELIAGSEPHDTSDHGTHVSGTVAGGDASGEHIGVAPETELMHGLVLPGGSGSFSRIIGGMEWAVTNDADVITMSLGSTGYSTWLIDPIRAAEDEGATVVASIGNSGEGTSSTPGNEYDSIGVGASNQWDGVGQYSGGELIDTASAWGTSAPDDWPDEYIVPSVTAPGSLVTSTVPGNKYSTFSGTSMAAPHVAGAVALIQSATDASHSATEIETALQETAWKPDDWDESAAEDSLGGADTRFGYGVIDVPAAIDFLHTGVPDAPAEFDVSVLDTTEPLEGADIEVRFEVTNMGDETGTQTLSLSTTPALAETTTELTLSPGETATETLSLTTESGDAGEYTATVASDDDEATAAVTVLADATFELDIVGTNDPVAGDDIEIAVDVENTGDIEDTQTVTLDGGALGNDETDVTLAGGASTAETLTIETESDDAGAYTVTVTTDDDTAETTVDVLTPAAFAVDIVETNEPIAGEDIVVTTAITNTGDVAGTDTVTLSVGGVGETSTERTLEQGETEELSLSVGTGADDADEYTATVTTETDEESAAVTVLSQAAFDVTIIDTNEPVAGDDIEVEVDVENTGTVDGTQTLTLSSEFGETSTDVSLSGGETTVVVLSVGTESGDAGTTSVTVKSEDTEATQTVTVREPATFDVALVETNEPVAGEALSVTAAVTNTGDVGGTETVTLSVDGLGDESTDLSLDAGETAEQTLAVETEPGDAGEYVAELSTGEETISTDVTVLEPEAFEVAILDTTDAVAGDDIVTEVAVTNTGDVEATQTLAMTTSPNLGETTTDITLSGGESTVENLAIETEAGDSGAYDVTVASEDDEDTVETTVLANSAFAVSILDTTEPVAGDDIVVAFEVTNTGDVEATQTVTLDVEGLGTNGTEVTLDGGESSEITLSVTTAADDSGNYTATVATDDDTAATTVDVLEPGNFAVDILATSDPVAGEDIEVEFAVENIGDTAATETVALTVGELGTDSEIISLAGGDTTTATLSVETEQTDAGEYSAVIASEDDEESANITVLEPAAFAVSILDTITPVEGEHIEVEFAVTNTGDVEATQPIALTTTPTLGEETTQVTLSGGDTTVETLSLSTEAGDSGEYDLTVASEDDAASETLTVLKPAAFDAAIVEANAPVAGDELLVTTEITNTGDVSETQTVTLSVDGVGTESESVSLAGGKTTTETLSLATSERDAGEYTAMISTADDSDSTSVSVLKSGTVSVEIVDANSPVAGAELSVTAEFTNTGDVETTETVSLAVTGLGTDSKSVSLAGEESTTETFSLETSDGDAGAYTAVVSSEDESKSTDVTVNEPAAFAVTITETNAPVVAGEDLTVSAAITNTGDVTGTETVTASADGLTSEAIQRSVAGGETVTETFSLATHVGDAGTYDVTVTGETDEDTAEATVLANGSFAVSISDVNEPVEGEHIEVEFAVANTGDVEATQTVSLTTAPDIGEATTELTLSGGDSTTQTLSVATESGHAGGYDVTVATDEDTDSKAVTVLEPASFAVDIVETNEPIAGEDITVTAAITNTGDVSGTETVTLSVGDHGTDERTTTVEAGETVETTLSVATDGDDAGEYTATVATENDEDTTAVTVLAQAEFAVSILETNNPVEGEQLDVTFEVTNTGDGAAAQTVSLSSEFGENSSVVSLDGGETTVGTLGVETESGDAGTAVVTIASDDDEASATVTVREPATFDVAITETTTPIEGDDIVTEFTVTNAGDVEATQTIGLETVPAIGEATTELTLSGGESATETLAVGTEVGDSGTYEVTVASEDSEASNAVTVLESAAFTVDIVETTTPTVGDDLAITVELANSGEVSETQTVTLSVAGLGTESKSVSLAGGETKTETFSLATSEGDAGEFTAVVATADMSTSTDVTVLADSTFELEITEATDPVAGELLGVTAEIENVGDVAGTETVTLAVEGLGETNTTVALSAGERVTESLSLETEASDAGEYVATVFTAETEATANITVLEPAAFTVDIEATTTPTEGEKLAVTAAVTNAGDVAGTETVTLSVTGVGEHSTEIELAGGETTTERFSLETESGDAGDYTATVETPTDTARTTVTVLESTPAEFRIQDVETNAVLVSGNDLTVSVTLRNVGDAVGEQSLSAHVVGVAETARTVTLAPNQTRTVTLVVDTDGARAGSHELVVETSDDAQTDGVVFRPPQFPNAAGPPQDLTGDGLYEDITGDGSLSIADVQALFNNLDAPGVAENPNQFGFHRTDRVSIFDVQALFNRL